MTGKISVSGCLPEMKWKKMIEYVALSHFPHLSRDRLVLSDEEFQGQVGRQRIALNPTLQPDNLFEWMVDFAFRSRDWLRNPLPFINKQ